MYNYTNNTFSERSEREGGEKRGWGGNVIIYSICIRGNETINFILVFKFLTEFSGSRYKVGNFQTI